MICVKKITFSCDEDLNILLSVVHNTAPVRMLMQVARDLRIGANIRMIETRKGFRT